MASRPGAAYLAGAPLLIAHRGGSALAPENTIEAFDQALRWWGADVLELDVQPTADGEAVVIHDSTVDRTTDGSGPVRGMSLSQLQDFDAGYRFTSDGGSTFPFRGRGIAVPSLLEVLRAFPGARLNIELKDERAQAAVAAAVASERADRRVMIAAYRRIDRARFAASSLPVSGAAEDLRQFYVAHRLHLSRFVPLGVDAFQMPEENEGRRILSPRFVADAHRRNLPVHVWTVDEPSDMRRLLGWGVDGLITDRPDRLARVLHETVGRPLAPGPTAGEIHPSMERLLRLR